ncbi:MAG TPA: GntR family transcriptional regulator [Pyrinomonadaceae bacterium]
MRLWLSKNSDVPLHEQLVTQIILGIVSNDLKAQQRLPSTRDLARRYGIHANTVSAAYRELARRGWVDFRKGSGVYVRTQSDQHDDKLELDQLIARFFRATREQGYSLAEIRAGIERTFTLEPPDHFVLFEPDPELRSILVAEIRQATKVKVRGADLSELENTATLVGAVPMVLYGHAQHVHERVDKHSDVLVLHSGSVAGSMRGQTRPPEDALVAIVSCWPDFLRWSRTLLVAAGLDPDALTFRDARERGWEKGLRSATFVITDSVMAEKIPEGCATKVFRVISEASLKEICDYAEKFLK